MRKTPVETQQSSRVTQLASKSTAEGNTKNENKKMFYFCKNLFLLTKKKKITCSP